MVLHITKHNQTNIMNRMHMQEPNVKKRHSNTDKERKRDVTLTQAPIEVFVLKMTRQDSMAAIIIKYHNTTI